MGSLHFRKRTLGAVIAIMFFLFGRPLGAALIPTALNRSTTLTGKHCVQQWHHWQLAANSTLTLACGSETGDRLLDLTLTQPATGPTFHWHLESAKKTRLIWTGGAEPHGAAVCRTNGCTDTIEVLWVPSQHLYIAHGLELNADFSPSCPGGYTCYYFAANGSDSGAGTVQSPYKTVSKAMSFVNKAVTTPTAVLFKQGDTWTGQEFDFINAIGYSPSQPTIVGTYGNGPRPVFDENNIKNHCFAANVTTAKYITLGYGVGFECKHAKYSGVNLLIGYSGETSTTPGMPGWTVENMYVHNSGNGCSNSNGPCQGDDKTGCSGDSCNYDYDNQISFVNVASCNLTKSGCAGDSVKFINNIVRYVGGHNCMEIQGDYGQPVVAGNIVGPGCGHEVVDTKSSGWNPTNAPGPRTELVHDNIVDVGVSVGYGQPGQAAFILLGEWNQNTSVEYYNNIAYDTAIGFQICAFDQWSANGAGGQACPASPNCNTRAFIYNNTVYANGAGSAGVMGPWCSTSAAVTQLSAGMTATQTSMTVSSGTNFVPSAGFQVPFIVKVDNEYILVGGASSSTSWALLTRGYLGTKAASHVRGATVKGGAFGTGYIDVRNNIYDGSNFNYLGSNEPSVILAEDYNDCGGAQGKPTDTAPSGGKWICSGPHDLSDVDPQYVSPNFNPPDSSSPPNFAIRNSLLIGHGQPGLVPGNNNIGALQ